MQTTWMWGRRQNQKLSARKGAREPQQGPAHRCPSIQEPLSSARASLASPYHAADMLGLRLHVGVLSADRGKTKGLCFLSFPPYPSCPRPREDRGTHKAGPRLMREGRHFLRNPENVQDTESWDGGKKRRPCGDTGPS